MFSFFAIKSFEFFMFHCIHFNVPALFFVSFSFYGKIASWPVSCAAETIVTKMFTAKILTMNMPVTHEDCGEISGSGAEQARSAHGGLRSSRTRKASEPEWQPRGDDTNTQFLQLTRFLSLLGIFACIVLFDAHENPVF